jgi:glucose-6-phosphate 1-dehydrogenase
VTEIAIQAGKAPHPVFRGRTFSNTLVLNVQPDEEFRFLHQNCSARK